MRQDSKREALLPISFQLEHLAMLGLSVYAMRLWWRLNRGRVNDHLPIHRHPKSPKDCPHCCQGVHLQKVRITREVRPWREVKSRREWKKHYSTPG